MPELTPSDHTRIIRAVLENAAEISKDPYIQSYTNDGKKPSGKEILRVLYRKELADSETNNAIKRVLDTIYEIEKNEVVISEDIRKITERVLASVEDCTDTDQIVEALRKFRESDVILSNKHQDQRKDIEKVVDTTIEIVNDGRDTIYNPNNNRNREKTKKLLKKDVKGALKGGIKGALAGLAGGLVGVLIGAGTLALAGAIESSAEEAFDQYF